ncbi:hypothetical protein DFH08DRAFT_695648 [Mycena albidolilacea]|uniref:BTB domain-containing protein n=1 Tax=Mycena albidolilacea TaxID=1033008 RepID=A0AAD7A6Y8_9AGAR|nr:hypothetical protein DFH08DRAFT_695648 [Mycena albidolilacea]
MSSPTAKRQRTEEPGPPFFTRSDIWYTDGSVVLQAHTTQFRVHWGILSQHSSFFREIQGLPQPNDQPTVDGCPIVELPDDVVDVEHLLRALYNPKIAYQPLLPLPMIAALIRLGRKYDFRDLLDSAVDRVVQDSPKTLAEYDALVGDGAWSLKHIVAHSGLRFDLAVLAEENNILSALPFAYYRATSLGLDRLLGGITRPDGTLASLPPVHLHRCIQGREKLLHAQYRNENTYGWLRGWDGTACVGPAGQCARIREILSHKYLDTVTVRAFQKLKDGTLEHFCLGCRSRISELQEAGRKKMWEELPGYFGLPPWEELKNNP